MALMEEASIETMRLTDELEQLIDQAISVADGFDTDDRAAINDAYGLIAELSAFYGEATAFSSLTNDARREVDDVWDQAFPEIINDRAKTVWRDKDQKEFDELMKKSKDAASSRSGGGSGRSMAAFAEPFAQMGKNIAQGFGEGIAESTAPVKTMRRYRSMLEAGLGDSSGARNKSLVLCDNMAQLGYMVNASFKELPLDDCNSKDPGELVDQIWDVYKRETESGIASSLSAEALAEDDAVLASALRDFFHDSAATVAETS